MPRIDRRKTNNRINQIVMLSAWSFILVLSSFIFLYVGLWLDTTFHTAPAFMLGLLILGISLCIGRLYLEYVRMSRGFTRIHHRT
ncbi:MAG TPA: AtpZ/AtpI family protein [Deltaproteobacteria bacterium]|nr:AtpZ/AtpI family protein [Deltaproteobacteria bacterium]